MERRDTRLAKSDLPVGIPLEFAVVDEDGARLYDRGAVLANSRVHRFLFKNFTPFRAGEELERRVTEGSSLDKVPETVNVAGMRLEIGARLGIRSLIGVHTPMYPGRFIGFAPDDSIFIAHHVVDGNSLDLYPSESVEILAVASKAIYLFTSVVSFVGRIPEPFVVLSPPSAIRTIRERSSVRVAIEVPLQYKKMETGNYEGVGITRSLSSTGLSFITADDSAKVGDQLQLRFDIKDSDASRNIEAQVIVRNIRPSDAAEENRVGVEFERVDPEDRRAIKILLFESLCEIHK